MATKLPTVEEQTIAAVQGYQEQAAAVAQARTEVAGAQEILQAVAARGGELATRSALLKIEADAKLEQSTQAVVTALGANPGQIGALMENKLVAFRESSDQLSKATDKLVELETKSTLQDFISDPMGFLKAQFLERPKVEQEVRAGSIRTAGAYNSVIQTNNILQETVQSTAATRQTITEETKQIAAEQGALLAAAKLAEAKIQAKSMDLELLSRAASIPRDMLQVLTSKEGNDREKVRLQMALDSHRMEQERFITDQKIRRAQLLEIERSEAAFKSSFEDYNLGRERLGQPKVSEDQFRADLENWKRGAGEAGTVFLMVGRNMRNQPSSVGSLGSSPSSAAVVLSQLPPDSLPPGLQETTTKILSKANEALGYAASLDKTGTLADTPKNAGTRKSYFDKEVTKFLQTEQKEIKVDSVLAVGDLTAYFNHPEFPKTGRVYSFLNEKAKSGLPLNNPATYLPVLVEAVKKGELKGSEVSTEMSDIIARAARMRAAHLQLTSVGVNTAELGIGKDYFVSVPLSRPAQISDATKRIGITALAAASKSGLTFGLLGQNNNLLNLASPQAYDMYLARELGRSVFEGAKK